MKPASGFAFAAIAAVAVCFGCNSKDAKEVTQAAAKTAGSSDDSGGTVKSERVRYVEGVLPILERSCFPCHGPKMNPTSMAGFRVDLRDHTVGLGKIVPGDPDESLLVRRLITDQESKRMPPIKADNPQLNAEEIEILKRWIKQGAIYGTPEN